MTIEKPLTIKELGEAIRHHREAQHMSIVALARLVNVSTATISRIEAGKRNPSVMVVLRVFEVLNVTLTVRRCT